MTDKTRDDFEAWAKANDLGPLWRHKDGQYVYWENEWIAYQAATQQSAARIASLEKHLQFVERWANHHGAKPHVTAKEALSVIQHYPPISAITRSYADGVVPDTFDPYARIAALEEEVLALRKRAVPSGCVVVPKEPTAEMMAAAAHISVCREDVYKAMIDAGQIITTPDGVTEWAQRLAIEAERGEHV